MLVSHLNEHEDAQDTASYVEQAGRTCVLVPGDLADRAHARTVIPKAVEEFGRVDILVNNAAFQMSHPSLEEFSDEEWDHTVALNLSAMFILCKDAIPHMRPGASIINSSSVNSDMPSPDLAAYAMWTPLIPATMPPENVEGFGQQAPLGRAAQPAELAPVYVLLASDEGSYVSGARVVVTGGKPIL